MASFFINRPIVAMVSSIIMTIGGIAAYLSLPVAQFPDIVPPEIQVTTTYTGADALTVEPSGPKDAYYAQFTACCKLAKALRVVPLVVPAAELGTPFNEEIERLRELVRIASLEGCQVAMRTEIGCMTEDPDTAVVLCNNVKGTANRARSPRWRRSPRQRHRHPTHVPHLSHLPHLSKSTRRRATNRPSNSP